MAKSSINLLIGKFHDPNTAKESANALISEGYSVYDVYSPFPIHGIEKLMGWNGSRLTTAAFIFGLTGTTCALLLQFYVMIWAWPMDIGGKPNFQGPALVPVTFELTVLFTAFGMVLTFFFVNKMFPWKTPILMDERVTDDVICVALNKDKISDLEGAKTLFTQTGAFEVTEKSIDDEYFDVNVG